MKQPVMPDLPVSLKTWCADPLRAVTQGLADGMGSSGPSLRAFDTLCAKHLGGAQVVGMARIAVPPSLQKVETV